MKLLARNKKAVTYSLYMGLEEKVDADGNFTGEKPPVYADPVTIKAYVTAARGSADLDQFGINIPYTHKIYVEDVKCPIDENSRVEIDGEPYAVLLVARSLNHTSYAVRRLTKPAALS